MRLPTLLVLCLGFFMVIIDTTITNIALPDIAIELHASITGLQWIVDAYTLSFAGFLLAAGHLSDQIGAKKTFQLSLLTFTIASFCCGLSTSVLLLTLFRLLQGMAAAFILPSSLSLINALYENAKLRAKAIGIWGGIGGIAAASGPVLGALLVYFFNWRAVFFVNIPVGILCLYFVSRLISTTKQRTNSLELDMSGQLLSIICIAALAFSFIEISRLGWRSPIIIGGFILTVISTTIFLITANKKKKPMIPIHFFKINHFSIACLIGMLMNIGFYGELFLLPLYFHTIRGYSILVTGFAILPLMIIVALASYYSGKVVSRIGCRYPMIIGLLSGGIGFTVLFMLLWQHMPSYYALVVPLMIIGFGVSFIMPAATIAAIKSLPESRAGLASGTFNMSRQLGSLIGVAVFGGVITLAANFITGMNITLLIAAGIYFIGVLIVFFIFRTD